MSDLGHIQGTWPAFIAGVVTSFHCVGMCGPLTCLFARLDMTPSHRGISISLYHGSRLLSYTVLGALAGGIGAVPFASYAQSWAHYLPWLMVFVFLLLSLGWEPHIPKHSCGTSHTWSMFRLGLKLPPWWASIMVGLSTPLLPCGPLYLLLGAALLSGSATRGAEIMFTFGLGTVVLLWISQWQWLRWQTRLSSLWVKRLQRGLALCGAAFIAARLLAGPSLADVGNGEAVRCPLCPSAKEPEASEVLK
ncbi:MAG: sulfite exporter TauE/SafE family protein [Methylacidiphilales bacterium]|nr:sulfite exporter TauE/SafE family protein [Candidatus Methylacidiphilales bacterium]MDW8349386.1 sulfite exporter TauE/SafE family protein [Verrucomicrobiae bacterium]